MVVTGVAVTVRRSGGRRTVLGLTAPHLLPGLGSPLATGVVLATLAAVTLVLGVVHALVLRVIRPLVLPVRCAGAGGGGGSSRLS